MSNLQYSTEIIIAALNHRKGLVYLAAKDLGCLPETITKRAKQEPAIMAALKQQRGEFVDIAERTLMNAVLREEPWAVALVLKTLGKKRGYVERIETRVGGDAKAPPVQTSKTKDLTFNSLPMPLRKQIAEHIRTQKKQQQEDSNGRIEKQEDT